ncbi:MAG: PIN/TRAM domain-containing protein [Anaerofustis sp.]
MLLKFIYFIIGFISGYQIGPLIYNADYIMNMLNWNFPESTAKLILSLIFGFIVGIIFLILIPAIAHAFNKISKRWIKELKNVSLPQMIMFVVALIISLVLAALICSPIYRLELPPFLRVIIVIVIYSVLIYGSILIVNLKSADLETMFRNAFNKENKEESKQKTGKRHMQSIPKVLDTSVIIDGRIFDILKTGFVEGPIVIPTFVLDELQYIADSSDGLKRNRGRRGLDILNKIQKELPIEVMISEKNYPDVSEVDTKLLRLAKDMKGKVVTNDYNLNKVAEFHGVDVLNTNDLSNAVKTVVLPGEEMPIQVIREGKESNQGVAYLDDGTMIVVEGGRHLIGKTIHVVVTSVLQTSAGRMIFAKPI